MAQQFDVTSVGVNPARDRTHRMRMYFLAMSLRVLCITSLFWLRGWWILIAALGAILLPYFAVLIANAVSHTGGTQPDAPSPLELTTAHLHTEDPEQTDGIPSVIVVDAPSHRRSSANAGHAHDTSAPRAGNSGNAEAASTSDEDDA
ncbi:MAG: DUF3099 domain-containing protein [Microbacteriaceae bacterium]|nr:DUF3099 domain-containing protein [Microbacteriaceae bacterium]